MRDSWRRVALLAALYLAIGVSARSARAQDLEENPHERAKWEYDQRAFPRGVIAADARLRVFRQLESMKRRISPLVGPPPGVWAPIGPMPVKATRGFSGRVAAIAIDPQDEQHWIAGTADGGIWQTKNGGGTWTTTKEDLESLAIGAVAFAPTQPNIVYAGTGEGNHDEDSFQGIGFLKSTDRGETWQRVVSTPDFKNSSIAAIVVEEDPKRVFAAVNGNGERGFYQSTDGGATWASGHEKGGASIFASATDLVGSVTFGHFGGISGQTEPAKAGLYRRRFLDPNEWEKVPGPWSALPGNRVGRVAIAHAPTRYDRFYVAISEVRHGPAQLHDGELLGLWFTENPYEGDATKIVWKEIIGIPPRGPDPTDNLDPRDPNLPVYGFCRRQCDYDLRLFVDRADFDTLYAGGVGLWQCSACTTPGRKWTEIGRTGTDRAGPPKDERDGIHVDQHSLAQTVGDSGPAEFRKYFIDSDYYQCNLPDSEKHRYSESSSFASGTFPCDVSAMYGTLSLTGSIAVSPARFEKGTRTTITSNLDVDAKAAVTMTVSASWTAPATLPSHGDSYVPRLHIVTSVNDEDDGSTNVNTDKCNVRISSNPVTVKPGQSATLNGTVTCHGSDLHALHDYYPTRFPVGTYEANAYVDFDVRESGDNINRTVFSAQAYGIYEFLAPKKLVVGNDGGVWSTTNGGTTWSEHNDTLPTLQFYWGSAHPLLANGAIGGMQDNGTAVWDGADDWSKVYEGDGGDSTFSRTQPLNLQVYAVAPEINRSTDGGVGFFNTVGGIDLTDHPFLMRVKKCPSPDPAKDGFFLTGTKRLYRHTTFFAGGDWQDANLTLPDHVTAIAFAPSVAGCSTYAAASPGRANDPLPAIRLTRNGEAATPAWTDIGKTPILPNRKITDLEFDPANANTLWVTFSGYHDSTSPAKEGHVFRTDDALAAIPTWRNVTPKDDSGKYVDVPANTVFLDPNRPGTVYVGTDVAIWASTDGGANWDFMGPDNGMPNVPVNDIGSSPTGAIVAFTHGRSAFQLSNKTADLSIVKTADPTNLNVGGLVTYTLTVKNDGPDDAMGVTVTDTPPLESELVSVFTRKGSCTDKLPIVCRLGILTSGASATIEIVLKLTSPGILFNEATVKSSAIDPRTGNNTSKVSVLVAVPTTKADRGVTKSHTPEPVQVGRQITYTIVAKNDGPDKATGVTVTDTLPDGVTLVSATASQGSCSGTITISCALGEIARGGTANITIICKANFAGTLVNRVRIAGADNDENPANDTATDVAHAVVIPAITKITPSSGRQGTRNIDLKIEGVNFAPGAAVSILPSTGIELVPPSPPNFGFVSPVELHQVIHIADGAPLGEREVFVTNPGGAAGGLRPSNVFTITSGANPVIRVAPASLELGSVQAKGTRQGTLTIFNDGTGKLTVRALGVSPPFAVVAPTAPFDVAQGGQQAVTIRFAPLAAGAASRPLVISSNDAARPSVTVPVTGTGIAPPILDLTPAALNFGVAALGQGRSLTVKIRNKGEATLSVTSIASDNARFSPSLPVPFDLAPLAERTFPVTFTPNAAGVASGKLRIGSNDPESPSLDVQIRGEGAAPPSTQTLSTDDGSVELAFVTDGLTMVNRFTPPSYPAQLKKISIFVTAISGRPSPAGAQVRLIAFAQPTSGAAPPSSPSLLVNQTVTLPTPNGGYIDFDIPSAPTIDGGDLYVGYVSPTPAGGVGFAADTNGPQQQRGWFSTNGISYAGPVTNSGTGAPANLMIRATMVTGAFPTACTWGIAPAKIALPKEGGSGTIDVSAPTDCPWAVTSDAPFVTFSSRRVALAAGAGNGSVHYVVDPATSDAARSATISIAQLDSTVTQAPPSGVNAFTRVVFVPIVLSTAGLNGSFFTSELTLTNRGTTSAVVKAGYTAAFGGGGGSAFDVLPPGAQRVYSDGLTYLKSLGTPIPESGNRGGTVTLSFSNLASSSAGSATVRTATRVADGRAGLAYSGVPTAAALTGPVYVLGLRQNATDRSNLALMNAGTVGDAILRVTVYSGDPGVPISATLTDIALPPGGFNQVSGILASGGLSLTNGYVKVERIAGTAPYFAYGVINDQANSDGSFVPPVPVASLTGRAGLTVPVVVETPAFLSELIATNFGTTKRTVRFALVGDGVTSPGQTASFTLDLAAGQQTILPSLVQSLRERGVAGIGPAGPTVVGSLFVSFDGGDASGVFVGVRTSSAGGGGRYGLFYTGVPTGAGATRSAWLFGLQQNGENRSNLALVNTGEVDGSGSVYRLEIFDGDTGALVKTVDGITLAARRWTQITTVLAVHAPGVTNAYVKVTKTAGSNPFLAYVVVNDGGQPGQRSGDGAFIPMSDVDE